MKEYFLSYKIQMVVNIQPLQRLYSENINVLDYSVQAKDARIKKTLQDTSPPKSFANFLHNVIGENPLKGINSSQQPFEFSREKNFKLEN